MRKILVPIGIALLMVSSALAYSGAMGLFYLTPFFSLTNQGKFIHYFYVKDANEYQFDCGQKASAWFDNDKLYEVEQCKNPLIYHLDAYFNEKVKKGSVNIYILKDGNYQGYDYSYLIKVSTQGSHYESKPKLDTLSMETTLPKGTLYKLVGDSLVLQGNFFVGHYEFNGEGIYMVI